MSLVWVVEARHEEVLLLVQQISSFWRVVMRRQIMTGRLARMLSHNLIRRPPKSARCHLLSIVPVLSHSKSKTELVAFHAAPCMTCYPWHMCAGQYLQMMKNHAERAHNSSKCALSHSARSSSGLPLE